MARCNWECTCTVESHGVCFFNGYKTAYNSFERIIEDVIKMQLINIEDKSIPSNWESMVRSCIRSSKSFVREEYEKAGKIKAKSFERNYNNIVGFGSAGDFKQIK